MNQKHEFCSATTWTLKQKVLIEKTTKKQQQQQQLIESSHGHTFRFCWTVQDLEVFLV